MLKIKNMIFSFLFIIFLLFFSHIFKTEDLPIPKQYSRSIVVQNIFDDVTCDLLLLNDELSVFQPVSFSGTMHQTFSDFPRDLGAMSTQDYLHLLAKHNQNCKESPESLLARAPRNFTRI